MYYQLTETIKTESGNEIKAGAFVRELERESDGRILVVKLLGGREFYVTEDQITNRVH